MGNCAGKPKDLNAEREAPLPAEEATTPAAEGVTVPQEQDGGETKKEEASAVEPAKTNDDAKPEEKEAEVEAAPAAEAEVAAKKEGTEEKEAEAPVVTA